MAAPRILVGDIAAEWKSIVEEIARDNPGINIVGQVENPLDVLLFAKDESVDVVLLSQEPDGSEPGVCSHFVLEFPNVVIVLVPVKGGTNVLSRIALSKKVCPASKESLTSLLIKFNNGDD
jgi:chemotaxis response regulator CheB